MTTRNSDSTGDALEEQRERLEQLRIWEHEIEALEATEAELEVEKIGADVALERAAEKSDFGIDSRHAAEIAAFMARKRELERELAGESVPDTDAGPPVGPSPEKLRAGIAALEDWLGASASAERWRRPGLIYTVLAVALVCTVAAALMLHMILLVLLVPIATAVGYLAFTERDADWIRLGAVRRFEQTRLRPPDPWETETVRSRMTELETALREEQVRAAAPVPEHQPTEDEAEARNRSELAIAMELVAVTDRLDAAIRDSGLDPARMDDELTGWLDQVHQARRIDENLSETRAKRKSLSRIAEDSRDAIFRFLALNDAAPPRGRADSDALAEGLQKIERRTRKD